MCGIAGIITRTSDHGLPQRLRSMTDVLLHRGPDGAGMWHNEQRTVWLGHRRLSILDLSERAAQPLQYLHYTLVFNGEIYNYRELKAELKPFGYQWYTSGDAEVVAAAFDHWGADCWHRFDGMFALALYDGRQDRLWLVRDRFGEKPLYYHAGYRERGRLDALVFGSEMKALWAAGIPREVNHKLLVNYLGLGWVQNPIIKTDTFFNHIQSLPPGCLLEVQVAAEKFHLRRWYKPQERIGHLAEASPEAPDTWIERFRTLLRQSVDRRLRSDMPVGTSLSGGLDSSSLVSIIRQLQQTRGKTQAWSNVCFSAVFPGFEKDEAEWSRRVADFYRIHQYTVEPTAADLSQYFDAWMRHQEEPVPGSSVFAQYLVYRQAREEAVSVLLDGQGADEILAGYPRYGAWWLQQLLRTQPRQALRERRLLQAHGMLTAWGAANWAAAWLPHQTALWLRRRAHRELMAAPLNPAYRQAHFDRHTLFKPEVRNLEDMLFFNTFQFGLEELLRYADRNSMAHGREVRLPFLSHELVEYVFALPAAFKMRDGYGKWLLRKAMEPSLPPGLAWRSDKVGFETPQAAWMQHSGMQERVRHARAFLHREGILQASELAKPVVDAGAHAAANYDWRYCCAAWLLQPQIG